MKKEILVCDKDEKNVATDTITIDVCPSCAPAIRKQIDAILKPQQRATVLSAKASTKKPLTAKTKSKKPSKTTVALNKRIRDWAAENDIPCPPRGLIPARVRDAYSNREVKA